MTAVHTRRAKVGGAGRVLCELGLSAYEAALLVALLQDGTGTSATLAERSGVPRTSVYGAMSHLVKQGLVAEDGSKPGSMRWSAEWPTVIAGLHRKVDGDRDAGTAKIDRLSRASS